MRDTQTTIAAMQTASKQLKMEHKKIDIGAIEDMQDDLSGKRRIYQLRPRVSHYCHFINILVLLQILKSYFILFYFYNRDHFTKKTIVII